MEGSNACSDSLPFFRAQSFDYKQNFADWSIALILHHKAGKVFLSVAAMSSDLPSRCAQWLYWQEQESATELRFH